MSEPAEWLAPTSLEEALALKAEHGDEATVVAGGTFLAILLNQRLLAPQTLLALARRPRASTAWRRTASSRLGAMTTHRAVERSPLVRERWPALARAFSLVASPRVRNQATVGGVLADADYASDPPALLAALGARAVVVSRDGAARDPGRGADHRPLRDLARARRADRRGPRPAARSAPSYRKFRSRSHEDRPVRRRRRRRSGTASSASSSAPSPAGRSSSRSSAPDGDAAEIGRRYAEAIDPHLRRARLGRLPPPRDRGRGAARPRGARGREWTRASPEPSATPRTSSSTGCSTRASSARRTRTRACSRVDASAVPPDVVVLTPGGRPRPRAVRLPDQGPDRARARARALRRRPGRRRRRRHAARGRRGADLIDVAYEELDAVFDPLEACRARRAARPRHAGDLGQRRGLLRHAPAAGDERLPPLPPPPRATPRPASERGRRRRRRDVPDGRRAARRHGAARQRSPAGRTGASSSGRGRRRRSTSALTSPGVFGLEPGADPDPLPADGRRVRGEDVRPHRGDRRRASPARPAARSSACSSGTRNG